MAAASKPESEPLLVDVDIEKKRAAAAAYWEDRMMIIGVVVYMLIFFCVFFTLSIMIYIEKQKPCQCQV